MRHLYLIVQPSDIRKLFDGFMPAPRLDEASCREALILKRNHSC